MHFPNNKNGFTLVELLVVIALTATLATFFFFNLSGYNVSNSLQRVGESVAAALRSTRQKSLSQENGLRWGMHFSNSSTGQTYTIFGGQNFASSTFKNAYTLRSGILFGNPPASSSLDVVFDPITGVISQNQIISLIDGRSDGLVYNLFVNSLGDVLGRFEKGLVAYWPMDEGTGTITYDASGDGNSGTLVNGPMWQSISTCKVGNCLSFNGSNNYITVPNLFNIPAGNAVYTIAAWIKPNSYGVEGIVGWGNWGTTNAVNALRLSSNGIINYWWSNDLVVTVSGLTDGKWHFVVAEFDGTTRSIYVDGKIVGSDNPNGHNAVLSNFRIGSTNNGEYFNGLIDDVRIYNRALSASEIADLYNLTK
jgi:prepilin-type N-terminal cleavage/methylation domain-containing protein